MKDGTVSRRQFTRTMVGLGLTGPIAAQMLATAGVSRPAGAQTRPTFTPTRRGGGGELKTLWWQAVSILNCHLAVGVKDNDGSRLFNEPLAAFDPDGNLVPILAAEVPTLENGGVAKDGLSVTWKLKKNVQWHDGKPFTADDVVFTWEFAADPATAATTAGNYKDIGRIDKLDSHTVKIGFKNPMPFWAISFCGPTGLVIPRHVFEPFKGAKSREAPANMKPVGTGPYRYVDFKPNDVVRAELNPSYHVPNWPFFDRVELKGGGDATSAARAVLQTGEYDFAWNLQVEDDILKRMEQGGRGRVDFAVSGNIEHVNVNQTDPWTEVDGERSSVKTKHPLLSDPAVRQALSLVIDRGSMQEQLYGRAGQVDGQLHQRPQPLSVEEHALGVQRREGQQGPRRRRLEARGGRDPRQGRQAAEVPAPDLDQPAPAEGAGHHQAGSDQSRDGHGAEDRSRLGLLRLRRGEPGQHRPLQRRPPDVRLAVRRRSSAVHARASPRGKCPARRTSSRAATRRAGGARSSTACTGRPRPRWIRSSGQRTSSG